MRNRLFFVRLLSAAAGVVLGVAFVYFWTRPADPSAAYFPAAHVTPGLDIPLGVDTEISGRPPGKQPNQLPPGPVYRPNPALTPGAAATTDLKAVCATPKHSGVLFRPGTQNTAVDPTIQQTVFAAYKIALSREGLYGLDYLVPLQLGGAQVASNVWPVPRTTRGLGFHEKEVLNIRLHVLVCHNEMTLVDAQQQMEHDWVSLWVHYGVASAALYN